MCYNKDAEEKTLSYSVRRVPVPVAVKIAVSDPNTFCTTEVSSTAKNFGRYLSYENSYSRQTDERMVGFQRGH